MNNRSIEQTTSSNSAQAFSDGDLDRLLEDLCWRRIGAGLAWLSAHARELSSLDLRQPHVYPALVCLLQWADAGWPAPEHLEHLLREVPADAHARLSLHDYVRLRVALGIMHLRREDAVSAIRDFETSILLLQETRCDARLLSLAHFWIARCYRQRGEYDTALEHILIAEEQAALLHYPVMVALMRVQESWILFQRQDLPLATTALQEAEAVLRDTDDHVTLGNIYSGFGRMARREGRYEQALEFFARSIEEYTRRGTHRGSLARSMAHVAHVKRLLAARLQRLADAEAVRRRKSTEPARENNFDSSGARMRCEALRAEAHHHLDSAAAIYGDSPGHGPGTVRVYRGYLHLDAGELDLAEGEAEQAFLFGEAKRDSILMARARILLSQVEAAKFEEEIGERHDQAIHAQRSHDFASEAVSLARRTQNRRLLAHALIIQGFALCNDLMDDTRAARKCCDEAGVYFTTSSSHDYLWESFEELKARISQNENVDTTLKMLSQGLVSGKTFQEIQEDFACIVIPKIWEQEGRTVSGVARRLSISPKKVRRILQKAGVSMAEKDRED